MRLFPGACSYKGADDGVIHGAGAVLAALPLAHHLHMDAQPFCNLALGHPQRSAPLKQQSWQGLIGQVYVVRVRSFEHCAGMREEGAQL